jgi:hypothetical protein
LWKNSDRAVAMFYGFDDLSGKPRGGLASSRISQSSRLE